MVTIAKKRMAKLDRDLKGSMSTLCIPFHNGQLESVQSLPGMQKWWLRWENRRIIRLIASLFPAGGFKSGFSTRLKAA
jgi:hypothetical protein